MRPRSQVDPDTGRVTRAKSARSACGKLAYSSRKLAKQVAAKSSKASGELIRAYHCPHGCHAWHVGHPPGTRGEHTSARVA